MRVLIAPQEFKGTLTAREAAEAIALGLRRSLPALEIETLPLADGGPGTVGALVEATGGRYLDTDAHDPLGRPIRARWGLLGGDRQGTAVIEMAAAAGLILLEPEERDPRLTTTFGAGEIIAAALDHRCQEIIIGAGGSGTNDGGAGMAQALGARLLDADGNDLPPGGAALGRLERIDVSGLDPRVREVTFIVATDVTNPLCGPDGASIVYGPQKGATPKVAEELDRALARYAEIITRDLGIDVASIPGSGAAGGLGAGLIAFCGATVRSGFEVVAEALDLDGRIAGAALVVTGEGRLDRQTAFGKTAAGVARACRRLAVPVIAITGEVLDDAAGELFDATFDTIELASSREYAMEHAQSLLERLSGERLAAWIRERFAL